MNLLLIIMTKSGVSEKFSTKNNLSETLITKILMGTLGCVPAYDRYFVKGNKISKDCKWNL